MPDIERVAVANLQVAKVLHDFVVDEVLPGLGIKAPAFWEGLDRLLDRFGPVNRALLRKRDTLQAQIDEWYGARRGQTVDAAAQKAFLEQIGYLLPEGSPFAVDTANVDDEIAAVAGPQLVVPVSNARYALNAANARWGSLYDALYGTDVIAQDGAARAGKYNPQRGAKVVAFARDFLDEHFALADGSHRDAVAYRVTAPGLSVQLKSGSVTGLKSAAALRGFRGDGGSPTLLLLVHHGLHVEVHVDRTHFIGRDDPAGISDVLLESAITTIQDCEDSVAAVDTEDKVQVYRNWLGLMNGSLEARI